MGWWFGRKSAPADARPFVPAWLQSDAAEVGFARSEEGVSVFVKSAGIPATFRDGSWEVGALRASQLLIGDKQVVGSRAPGIASPARGKTIDAEARAALNAILDALRAHGLIET
jgi:hypothetical protein